MPADPTLPEPRPDDEGRETVFVEVSRALLPHFAEWSKPLRLMVASEGDGVVRLILQDITPHPAPLGATDEGLRAAPVGGVVIEVLCRSCGVPTLGLCPSGASEGLREAAERVLEEQGPPINSTWVPVSSGSLTALRAALHAGG